LPIDVVLGERLEAFVRGLVQSGRYKDAGEVIRAGLALLEDQERLDDEKLTSLIAAIALGLDSGEPRDADEIFRRLEAKYSSATEGKPA
jgi:antitoxin ParD1/3/4